MGKLTRREVSAILAGLYTLEAMRLVEGVDPRANWSWPRDILETLSDGGEIDPLTGVEVERLRERVNCGEIYGEGGPDA